MSPTTVITGGTRAGPACCPFRLVRGGRAAKGKDGGVGPCIRAEDSDLLALLG